MEGVLTLIILIWEMSDSIISCLPIRVNERGIITMSIREQRLQTLIAHFDENGPNSFLPSEWLPDFRPDKQAILLAISPRNLQIKSK